LKQNLSPSAADLLAQLCRTTRAGYKEYTGAACSFICTKISRCQPQIFHLRQNLSLPQDFKLQFSGLFRS
jgi:hypothetical protein